MKEPCQTSNIELFAQKKLTAVSQFALWVEGLGFFYMFWFAVKIQNSKWDKSFWERVTSKILSSKNKQKYLDHFKSFCIQNKNIQ